ncbi:MAG: carboxylating nicotinate-nucleotide diphosphorylase [Deltaproteobacteria bacterium]|nr:carboxylating nicotinate-nucleotide diphosphorylase [Deltaproteobacteria bacterium]
MSSSPKNSEGSSSRPIAPILAPLYPAQFQDLVRATLLEDLGRGGDLTSDAVIPDSTPGRALVVARQQGCIAGLEVARCAFQMLDGSLRWHAKASDGDVPLPGTTLAVVEGSARGLLAAERTALNFLGHLSGVATVTRTIAEAIAHTPARVACTRKTTPLLRTLEKYAVRAGGGANHRFGLDDAVMIKDNHRSVAGSLTLAVERVRAAVGHMVKIEVEVDTLEQLLEALPLHVDALLLDNMSLEELREAVELARGANSRAVLEASGGITPQTAPAIAETGVDVLSIGWITHSAPRLDVALDIDLS